MLKFLALSALAFALPANAVTYVFTAHVIPIAKWNGGNGGGSTKDVSDLNPLDIVISGNDFSYNEVLHSGNYTIKFGALSEKYPSYVAFDNPTLGLSGFSYNPPMQVAWKRSGDFYDIYRGDWTLTVNGSLVSLAVPEPSTWGLLILGFGMIGARLRTATSRSQRHSVA